MRTLKNFSPAFPFGRRGEYLLQTDKTAPLVMGRSFDIYIFLAFCGPDGELGASLRYLSQRYTAPYSQVKGLLTDIGVEETSHKEWN